MFCYLWYIFIFLYFCSCPWGCHAGLSCFWDVPRVHSQACPRVCSQARSRVCSRDRSRIYSQASPRVCSRSPFPSPSRSLFPNQSLSQFPGQSHSPFSSPRSYLSSGWVMSLLLRDLIQLMGLGPLVGGQQRGIFVCVCVGGVCDAPTARWQWALPG